MIKITKEELEKLKEDKKNISEKRRKLRADLRDLNKEYKTLKEEIELKETLYKYQEGLVDDNEKDNLEENINN